jgi:hypothetical protein
MFMSKFFLFLGASFLLLSCSKEDSVGPSTDTSLTLLQNKWVIDSVYIYPTSGLSSNYLYAYKPPDVQYEDFKADKKLYSYGGSPTTYYDTALYNLLPDSKAFLVYLIKNGVASSKSDTGHILKLTTSSFVYYSINPVGEYGKFVLKR